MEARALPAPAVPPARRPPPITFRHRAASKQRLSRVTAACAHDEGNAIDCIGVAQPQAPTPHDEPATSTSSSSGSGGRSSSSGSTPLALPRRRRLLAAGAAAGLALLGAGGTQAPAAAVAAALPSSTNRQLMELVAAAKPAWPAASPVDFPNVSNASCPSRARSTTAYVHPVACCRRTPPTVYQVCGCVWCASPSVCAVCAPRALHPRAAAAAGAHLRLLLPAVLRQPMPGEAAGGVPSWRHRSGAQGEQRDCL